MAAAPRVIVPERGRTVPTAGRPVLLATFAVPFDPAASEFAVDAAVETGEPLILANVVDLPPLAMSVSMGHDQLEDTPELAESLLAPARLAHSLGVRVERLRVKSPRPVEALLELVGEREPGILVFGPDRSRLRPRRYRKAVRAIQARAACLVWVA